MQHKKGIADYAGWDSEVEVFARWDQITTTYGGGGYVDSWCMQCGRCGGMNIIGSLLCSASVGSYIMLYRSRQGNKGQ